jgi:mono/diheme cytochrome c family protein
VWNRIQWLLCGLIVCGAVLLLSACPQDDTAGHASDAASAQVYADNCALCHGQDREGAPGMAPALTAIKQHWASAEEMEKYLAAPQEYAAADSRLKENLGKYSMRMPNFPRIDDAQRLALAKWLLANSE